MTDDDAVATPEENNEPPGFEEGWSRVNAVKNSRTPIYISPRTSKAYRINLYQPNSRSVVAVYLNGEKVTELRSFNRIIDVDATKIEVQSEADNTNLIQYMRLK